MQKEEKISILQCALRMQTQSEKNYLDEDAIEKLSEQYSLSKMQVLDVLTFYEHLSLKKRGLHIIRVCKSPCCHFRDKDRILQVIKVYLNIDVGETTKDGMFTLELTNCIGLCDQAPAMMIDDNSYGSLDTAKVIEILERMREEKNA